MASLLLAGCVVSLNPLYTAKDLTFDSALVGVWGAANKTSETWKFENAGSSNYKLTVAYDDLASPFVAHLVRLGGHRFLDICPDKSGLDGLKQIDLYKAALMRGHLFIKVVRIEPTLQMGLLNEDWLSKLLKKDPGAIAHQDIEGDGVVLTDTTRALQDFVVKHWDSEGAWGDTLSELKRK